VCLELPAEIEHSLAGCGNRSGEEGNATNAFALHFLAGSLSQGTARSLHGQEPDSSAICMHPIHFHPLYDDWCRIPQYSV